MIMTVQSEGPSTARAARSTTMPGSAISKVVTQEAADSNHFP